MMCGRSIGAMTAATTTYNHLMFMSVDLSRVVVVAARVATVAKNRNMFSSETHYRPLELKLLLIAPIAQLYR